MAYKLPQLNHLLVHAMFCADDPRRRNEGGSALNGLCRSLDENQREVRELTGCRIQPGVNLAVPRLVRWRNIERLCAELNKVGALRMICVVLKVDAKIFHTYGKLPGISLAARHNNQNNRENKFHF